MLLLLFAMQTHWGSVGASALVRGSVGASAFVVGRVGAGVL